jgi:hypothetical protein
MAGLFDFLSRSYFTNKRTEERAQQFKDLLGQQDTSPLQGPVQPGQPLLGNRELSPQFYLQAATIPGYEQFGLQAQTGQQAMERQQQSQGWQQNNMTAAQAAQLAEQQRQWDNPSAYQTGMLGVAQQNADTSAFGNYNMTPYQQAQIGISQQNADTSAANAGSSGQYKPPANYMLNQTGTGLMPIPGSAPDVQQREKVSALDQGINAAEEYIKFIENKGGFESGADAKEIQQRATNLLVNAQAAASNSGTLNAGEAETYASRVPQVNSIWGGLLQNQSTSLAQLQALRDQLKTQRDSILKAQGRAPSGPPPPPPGFKVQ